MVYSSIPRALADSFGQLGWRDGLLNALSIGLSRLTRGRVRLNKYYFVAQPVAAKPWLPGKRGAAIEVRSVGPSDSLASKFPRPAWAAPYRFSQGAVCLAALNNGDCVGFLWLAFGPYLEDEVRCRYIPLPHGEAAWDFDVYVYPEQRNSLVFLRLWDEANRYLASQGVRWSLSRISAFNPGSMASHARMGTRRIGAAVFLSIGPLQVSMATVTPRFFLSWKPDRIPSFALSAERQELSVKEDFSGKNGYRRG